MTPGLWSVLLQALGSVSTVAAAALVTWRFGLAAQGEFGLLRSWTDALTSALALGLPQGLLHLQYREGLAASALLAWTRRYLLIIALTMLAAAAIVFRHAPMAPFASGAQAAVIALALPFAVAHLLWRSILLRACGVVRYAAISSLPALVVLAGIAVLCVAGQARGFEWVLLAASVLAAGVSGALAWGRAEPIAGAIPVSSAAAGADAVATAPHLRPLPARILWTISLQTWAQGLMAALLPALLLSVAGLRGATLGQIGLVSLGLQVYLLFAVLAAYSAPMIYDRLARSDAPVRIAQVLAAWRDRIGLPPLGSMAAAALLGPWTLAQFMPSVAPHVLPTTLLAVAGSAALLVRLLWTLLQAGGQVRELSVQAVWRLLLACGLTAWLVPALGAPLAVPLALLGVEALTLARLAVFLQRRPGARQ